MRGKLLVVLSVLAAATVAQGQIPILAPGDGIIGGQRGGSDFNVGVVGFAGNAWPGGEAPEFVIDGVGQKYLNFGIQDTGFIVTPSLGSSIVNSIQLWTANDEEPRDPSSYEVWGTNVAIGGAGPFSLNDFTQISSGALSLPATRNAGGNAPLLVENSQTVNFANSDAYTSYMVLFPDVKNSGIANSMQVAEVQLFGTPDVSTTLSLEVNQASGNISLVNGSAAPNVDINSYQLHGTDAFDPAGWVSLADNPGFPGATSPGAGDGWEEGGGSNASLLTEAFLLGASTLATGQRVSLGAAYDTMTAATDIEFVFTRPDGFRGQGTVIYVSALACDFDSNGVCDGDDIDMLVENIAVGPADPSTFDLTGDGQVDLADRDEWLAQAGAANLPNGNPYLLGDSNLDGVVDGIDFIEWNSNKFTVDPAWTGGDFNADGVIDGQDFIIWNTFKFQSSDVNAVPEPSGLLVWCGLGIVVSLGRRRFDA